MRLSAATIALFILGALSLGVYSVALAYGRFRPGEIEPFLVLFGVAFLLYGLAIQVVLRAESPIPMGLIVGGAALFCLVLLFALPTLSDDMYRYVWDGRVQAHGINPYRYTSDAPELAYLRDDTIWKHMNRISAHTIYPPGAQIVFALVWRVAADSIFAFKAVMAACLLIGGVLLGKLARALGKRPERALILLWSPLALFELAHSGHVDALYLPLIIGAFLLRANAPPDRVSIRREAAIGVLLGLATLVKFYPAILAAPLWSIRDSKGVRQWRLALPVAMILTIAAGYALYVSPGVDLLGFLSSYQKEFFNIAPLPYALMDWAQQHNIAYYVPVNALMPLLVIMVSVFFVLFPARTAREAISRCAWPIGIYLLVNQNLFSWYVLFILPLVALDLRAGRWLGWRLDAAFGWWLLSGLTALSYTLFITGFAQPWAAWIEFVPIYVILIGSGLRRIRKRLYAFG